MLKISGELYAPVPGSPDRKGAAVVVSHPMTGVKEQTSADHARLLSRAGFCALAFDAGYQGKSTGQPRGQEDPHQRVEDTKAAVSYLSTLKGKLNRSQIAVLGICASGGYASYAARSDLLVKVLATVSAACVGRMTRNGTYTSRTARRTLGLVLGLFSAEYYRSERGDCPRSNEEVPPSSYDFMVSYDSFKFQHLISARPLLMIAGSKPQTLYYSAAAVAAAREPKELFIVQGMNHFYLYDDLAVSGPELMESFRENL